MIIFVESLENFVQCAIATKNAYTVVSGRNSISNDSCGMILEFCDHSLVGNLSLFYLAFKILPAFLSLPISRSGVYNDEDLIYICIFHLAINSLISFNDVDVYELNFTNKLLSFLSWNKYK